MLIPSPTEYLKTHIIAFLAGAATVVAAHLYAKLVGSQDEDWRGAWPGSVGQGVPPTDNNTD